MGVSHAVTVTQALPLEGPCARPSALPPASWNSEHCWTRGPVISLRTGFASEIARPACIRREEGHVYVLASVSQHFYCNESLSAQVSKPSEPHAHPHAPHCDLRCLLVSFVLAGLWLVVSFWSPLSCWLTDSSVLSLYLTFRPLRQPGLSPHW